MNKRDHFTFSPYVSEWLNDKENRTAGGKVITKSQLVEDALVEIYGIKKPARSHDIEDSERKQRMDSLRQL